MWREAIFPQITGRRGLVFSTHQRVVALKNRDLDREVLQLMQFLSMVEIKGLKKKINLNN